MSAREPMSDDGEPRGLTIEEILERLGQEAEECSAECSPSHLNGEECEHGRRRRTPLRYPWT